MAAAQDGASWDKLWEQIGEQTREQIREPLGEHIGKPQGEQTHEEGVRRRRRPASRRVQRWRAARRRRQQRKLQCASLAPQACVAGVAKAAAEAGAAHWEVADQAEVDAILELGTWDAGGCVLPVDKQALPTHFVQDL
jgi:hypothetical protein